MTMIENDQGTMSMSALPPTGDEKSEEEKSEGRWTFLRPVLTIVELCKHALIIALTSFLIYLASKYSTAVNLHVGLCSVGYVLLMSEALCALYSGNVWSSSLSRRANSHIHWILQASGMTLTVAGVAVLSVHMKSHFRTIHAITGLASLVTMCPVMLLGAPTLYATRLRNLVRPVVVRFAHNVLGIACYVLGMVAQCYGYRKSWLRRSAPSITDVETICIVVTSVVTILSLVGAFRSLYHQARTLFR